MADYTALVEAGNALVEMLRDNLTPEPLGNRELIALCSPHESENNQLTLYLYQIEEENPNMTSGYYQVDRDTQRIRPAQFALRYLVTAHSKAPAQLREADQHRIVGAAVQALRDNPVIPQHYLPLCAGLAVKAGMDPFAALQAITINPARHLGIADRVGSLEVGKDADVVVTDGNPMVSDTTVLAVFLNGQRVVG